MVTLCNSCESQDTCEIFEIMGECMPITHCKNYIQTRRETVRAKQTNGDRIRSMTDEELAELLTTDATCPCVASDNCNGHTSAVPINECRKHWEAWLRKEAEDD